MKVPGHTAWYDCEIQEMKLDRTDKEVAKEVFEFLLPDEKVRQKCAEFLVRSIQTANQLATDRWGITLYPNSILMNCGRIEILIIQPDFMHVIIDSESLPELPPLAPKVEIRATRASIEMDNKELPPETGTEIQIGKGFYPSVPDSIACDFSAEQAELVLPLIQDSHIKLIQKAVQTPLFQNRKNAHSPGVIEYLNNYLKEQLFQPGYIPTRDAFPDKGRLLALQSKDSLPDLDQIVISVWEGDKKFVTHLRRERDPKIIEAKKKQVLKETGRLKCEVCGFDFREKYGELGENFAEAHHKTPLSAVEDKIETTLDDLAILCSNCHRMVHRTNPMESIEQFRERLR